MEGRGITNYSTSKPSHSFTTKTTEFDDELLKRGIITPEEAILAKGAAPDEVLRLTHLNERVTTNTNVLISSRRNYDNKNCESSRSNTEHEEYLMQIYRKKHLHNIKYTICNFGFVMPITRAEWMKEVNEASAEGRWVIVLLTSQNSSAASHLQLDLCHLMEDKIIPTLAKKFDSLKFVSIPSKNAIPDWPENQLPTLFFYRYSKLQHQLVGLSEFGRQTLTVESLELKLNLLGVLETDIYKDSTHDYLFCDLNDKSDNFCNGLKGVNYYHFGREMSNNTDSDCIKYEKMFYDDVD